MKNIELEKRFLEKREINDEYVKPDKEVEDCILDKVEDVKNLVRNFVDGTFGEEAEEKLEELFLRLPIIVKRNYIVQEDAMNFGETIGWYDVSKKEIVLSQEIYDKYKDTSFFTTAIIHEIAHACSFEISKGGVIDGTSLTEEAFADLFTEMCINYNLKDGIQIDDFKQFMKETKGKELYKMTETTYSGDKFGDYIRCILYPLRLENKDIDAIKEYFFGSKEKFIEMLDESMGGEFEKVLKEINNEVKKEGTDIKESVENIIIEIVSILCEQGKTHNKKSFSEETDLKDGSLYSTETSYIALEYADDLLREELEKQRKLSLSEKSVEELEEFFNNTAKVVGNRYQKYENSLYMDEVVERWHEVTYKDFKKFDTILTLTKRIPKELILKIAEEQGFNENMDVLEYIELVYKYIGTEKPENELIEYIMNHCNKKLNSEEKHEIFDLINETDNHPLITDSTAEYLSNLDLDEKQEIDMYKFFYHEDREDGINKLINILKDKQILYSEITDENKDFIKSMLMEINRAKVDWEMFKGKQDVERELDENGKFKLTPNNMILSSIIRKKKMIEKLNEIGAGVDIQNAFFEEIYANDENISKSDDLTARDLIGILIGERDVTTEVFDKDEGVEYSR